MATLLDVKGIGPHKAKLLQERGIHTIEDLANASEQSLIAIPTFTPRVLPEILGSARSLMVKPEEGQSSPDPVVPETQSVAVAESEEESREPHRIEVPPAEAAFVIAKPTKKKQPKEEVKKPKKPKDPKGPKKKKDSLKKSEKSEAKKKDAKKAKKADKKKPDKKKSKKASKKKK